MNRTREHLARRLADRLAGRHQQTTAAADAARAAIRAELAAIRKLDDLATRTARLTELTEAGEQYVIDGCEQRPPAGKPHQLKLWS